MKSSFVKTYLAFPCGEKMDGNLTDGSMNQWEEGEGSGGPTMVSSSHTALGWKLYIDFLPSSQQFCQLGAATSPPDEKSEASKVKTCPAPAAQS